MHPLSSTDEQRPILSIQPSSRGLGYAVLSTTRELLDWGIKRVRGHDPNPRCLRAFQTLHERHRPAAVILEDTACPGCRRAPRIIDLLIQLRNHAPCRTHRVSRLNVLKHFGRDEPLPSRQAVAAAVAECFPHLKPHVPSERKLWRSEDPKMAYFWAVAMGLVHLEPTRHPLSN